MQWFLLKINIVEVVQVKITTFSYALQQIIKFMIFKYTDWLTNRLPWICCWQMAIHYLRSYATRRRWSRTRTTLVVRCRYHNLDTIKYRDIDIASFKRNIRQSWKHGLFLLWSHQWMSQDRDIQTVDLAASAASRSQSLTLSLITCPRQSENFFCDL